MVPGTLAHGCPRLGAGAEESRVVQRKGKQGGWRDGEVKSQLAFPFSRGLGDCDCQAAAVGLEELFSNLPLSPLSCSVLTLPIPLCYDLNVCIP
jgi:hypothetical protein